MLPAPSSTSRRWWANSAATVSRRSPPRDRCSANTGVSATLSRTYMAIRHQHDAEQERQSPRPVQERRAGFADGRVDDEEHQAAEHQPAACAQRREHAVAAALTRGCMFVASSAAPAHSPPTAKPCASRSANRITGAATPMVAAPGTRPTATVDRPMMSSVVVRVALRPSRSPKWPKNAAPAGRDRKAAAKVAIDATAAIVGPGAGRTPWETPAPRRCRRCRSRSTRSRIRRSLRARRASWRCRG